MGVMFTIFKNKLHQLKAPKIMWFNSNESPLSLVFSETRTI